MILFLLCSTVFSCTGGRDGAVSFGTRRPAAPTLSATAANPAATIPATNALHRRTAPLPLHHRTIRIYARRSIHPSAAARTCAPLPVTWRRTTSLLSCRSRLGPVRLPRTASRLPADGPFRSQRRYNIISFMLTIDNNIIYYNILQ